MLRRGILIVQEIDDDLYRHTYTQCIFFTPSAQSIYSSSNRLALLYKVFIMISVVQSKREYIVSGAQLVIRFALDGALENYQYYHTAYPTRPSHPPYHATARSF